MVSVVVQGSNCSIPSSSSSSSPRWTYDVFLSFRGEDTRDNFVDHLYTALDQKGIHTFKDDEKLQRGKTIAPELVKAIEGSRFSVVVLSKNYASSRWCLDELVKILECNTIVYPVFYHVNPSQVRSQSGTFGKRFAELVSKHEMEKAQRWREALEKVGNLSGWPYPSETLRFESKLVQELVGKIFSESKPTYSSVIEDLVGIKNRMGKVIELLGLGLDGVRVVGIWGIGGMGKTTIARAVFDSISRQFEGSSFVENVREISKKGGLKTLQEQLISEILMEKDLKVGSIITEASMIENKVSGKKVLIVLDDVDTSTELEKLVGKLRLHTGSRIIITTRDHHKLITYGVTHVYEVEALEEDDAVELFKSKAFGKHPQPKGYEDLVDCAVEYAKGLPLALKVLGSFLFGRSYGEWESALSKLKESPHEEVHRALRISFDALVWHEKEIFLDIACFFKGKYKNDVTKILDSCNFNPEIGIAVLVEKSLLSISKNNELMMHDLIQQMGWQIVREESSKDPGKRSRLWLHEDMKRVLMDNVGTNKVEGIVVEFPNLQGGDPKDFECLRRSKLRLSSKAFANMTNLRILRICCLDVSDDLKHLPNNLKCLDWCGYPLKYMPSTFQPEHLVELHITYSYIEQLWKGAVHLEKLRIMNLSHSRFLTKSPSFIGVPNLERLILKGCTGLVNIHPSIGDLRRLIVLNLEDCKNLKSLPIGNQLESLEILIASGCSRIKNIMGNFQHMKCLSKLYLDRTGIQELPPSVVDLTNLRLLNLNYCTNLRSIPSSICQLKALRTLILSGCSKLSKLPEDVGYLACLKELRVDCSAIRQFPPSIVLLKKLETLSFRRCEGTTYNSQRSFFSSSILRRLEENSMSLELPNLSRFEYLRKLDLSLCNLKFIPTTLRSLQSLERLDLSGNDLESLPASMNQLTKLHRLYLGGCKRLQELPELSSGIRAISAYDCESLRTILSPSIYKNILSIDFTNCFKLVQVEQSNILQDKFLTSQFQGNHSRGAFNFIFPGSEISKWFKHRRMGHFLSIHLPPHWYSRRFLGFVFSIAVRMKNIDICVSVHIGDHHIRACAISNYFQSEIVWITYMPRDLLDITDFELEQFNECGSDLTVEFFEFNNPLRVNNPDSRFRKKVIDAKMCGARLIYLEDNDDDDEGNGETSIVFGSEDFDRSIGVKDDFVASKRIMDDPNDDNNYEVRFARPPKQKRA